MINLIKNRDYYGLSILMLLVVLIGYQEMVSPAIGIFILVVITEGLFLKRLKFEFNKFTLLFVVLFVLYLIGLIWSEHREIGWKLLEYKMAFFIFPVLFLFPKRTSNASDFLSGIVWGCLILSLRFLAVDLFQNVDLTYYEISRQYIHLHPTYAAIYFTIGIVYLIEGKISNRNPWKWYYVIPLIILFSIMILASTSLAGILYFAFVIAFFIAYFIKITFHKIVFWVYLLLIPIVLIIGVSKISFLKYDLEMIGVVKSDISQGKQFFLEKHKANESGTIERVMMWYISTEIIVENPLGVGTGDIDFYLLDKCKKYDLKLLYELNLNPHNQYLQIGIDLGFLGIIYLIGMLGALIMKSIRSADIFLFLTVLSLLFNSLFESVLQRQSGIVFYSLIICLLLVYRSTTTNAKLPNVN
ncbi:MAG: O-antigen ligase family protein [Crocinitomicaceae bacterium]|nr:O-antigen ligase family protein [Crocinitomicaceae bacterium]